jgi:RNA polymerase sigma factor (sigma-70 family)
LNKEQTIALYQPTLQAVAYRLLKCKADAEDMVQETFLKWLNAEQEKIQNTKAYLIRAVTNNCLNHLNAIKKKSLDAIHWTEMVERFKETDFSHIDFEAEMIKAFRILQHKLEPLERAVYLLKEVFDFDYEALQVMLDKKQEYCRQLLCRAKKKLEQNTSISSTERPKTTLIETFKKACDVGNASEFITELKNDIALAINKKSADLKSLL